MSESDSTQYPHKAKGLMYAAGAFGWWAFVVPTYFKILMDNNADPIEAVSQRVLFGLPILIVMLFLSKQIRDFTKAIMSWQSIKILIPSTAFILINWYFFIYAISTERLAHASMGYYINPLFSIALGYLFFGERPRPVQWGAIALAGLAVVVMGFAELGAEDSKGLPWISLLLPFSFGIYGLLRKKVNVGAAVGLSFEMMLLFPLAIVAVIYLNNNDRGIFLAESTPFWLDGVMLLGGIVTIVPLICFTNAVRLLPLSTVGLLQYTAPTGQLFLSFLAFGETFTPMKFASFAIIWIAVTIYSWDMIRGHREMKSAKVEILE
ncbi:MAG: EamA family transporter RarD [Phycisphaerales bacterium]|nr:EamA family transporter RarD [Phycisphaerales bacterium]